MAAAAGMDINLTVPHHSEGKLPFLFASPVRTKPTKRFTISCNSTNSPPNLVEPHQQKEQQNPKTSLSDQLKPLSETLLSEPKRYHEPQKVLSKNPRSTWVNPTKPKRSVLSLQRHQRSPSSQNPRIRDLKLFAYKLNGCDSSEGAFSLVLGENPPPLSSEDALFVLKSLRSWRKAHLFLKWVRTQNLFPVETIFYNVTMRALRHDKQFELTEELAHEMIRDGIELDNVTYSTIITCAKRSNRFDKAMEWFERIYKSGLMPDEVTYSAVLDVYAKLGKVEEVTSLYERARASGWKPDPIAFSVLGKMFGEAGDLDGIKFVLGEMKSLGVQLNLVVYNTLLVAMGKAGKPRFARNLFQEMIEAGIAPDERTLTALAKIYGKARWTRDALELWEQIRSNGWPMDIILCNTLLSMCAELGLEEEAVKLFEDMKSSERCRPNSWSYTAMLNMYGNRGKVERAMELFNEMSELGVQLDIMGCTCLIQSLGREKRIDDLVKVFVMSVAKGMEPDDKLCGCLLSVVAFCDEVENVDKVLACVQQANPNLFAFIKLLEQGETSSETIKEQFKTILSEAAIESRKPFCNCLIDIFRKRDIRERTHELFHLGRVYGLYPDLHSKTADEWCLNVRSLSVGAACTAFEEWMETLSRAIEHQEELPALFSAHTNSGTSQGLARALASHVEKLTAPFRQSQENGGILVATREDLVSWIQSKYNDRISTVPA